MVRVVVENKVTDLILTYTSPGGNFILEFLSCTLSLAQGLGASTGCYLLILSTVPGPRAHQPFRRAKDSNPDRQYATKTLSQPN